MTKHSDNANTGGCSNGENARNTSANFLTSIPREFDIFGFYLSVKQVLIAFLLSFIMCGPIGTFMIFVALGLYTVAQRNSWIDSSQRRNTGRGGGSRWGGGGSNIRGVKDLPQDSNVGG